MNRQQICLALALHEASVEINVSTFDHRLVLQKAVCMLQYAGVHLGYRFRWHIKGPYSSDLAGDVFWMAESRESVEKELNGWELDGESKTRIASIKRLFEGQPVTELARKLELMASILFMVRTGQAKADDAVEIQRLLETNEKDFTVRDAEEALATLRRHGFKL